MGQLPLDRQSQPTEDRLRRQLRLDATQRDSRHNNRLMMATTTMGTTSFNQDLRPDNDNYRHTSTTTTCVKQRLDRRYNNRFRR